jgi:hypothetical protein
VPTFITIVKNKFKNNKDKQQRLQGSDNTGIQTPRETTDTALDTLPVANSVLRHMYQRHRSS